MGDIKSIKTHIIQISVGKKILQGKIRLTINPKQFTSQTRKRMQEKQ